MPIKPRSKTQNRGANDERVAILRKVREMKDYDLESASEALTELELWIMGRTKRTAAKPRGLGKR